jgi:hypothetical protein
LTVEYEATMLLIVDTKTPARPRHRRRREGARMPVQSLPEKFFELDLTGEEFWFVLMEWSRLQLVGATAYPGIASRAFCAASELPVHRAQALRELVREAAA